MAFSKKTWVNRSVQYAGRYLQTAVSGVANTFDLTRSEGTVFVVGDKPDAAALNDLETRVDNAITGIEDSLDWIDITSQCTWSPLLNTNIVEVTEHFARVNPAIRMVELSFVLNAGRTNGGNLVQIPTAYRPSATSIIVIGASSYDNVANIKIEYMINTNGAIIGIHSAAVSTGYYEFCHFMFAY